MQEFVILSKGKYTAEQSDKYVLLNRYIFIREGEETYLMLQWENTRNEKITRLRFTVVETEDGQEINRYEVDWALPQKERTFGADKKIKVDGVHHFYVIVHNIEYENTAVRLTGRAIKENDVVAKGNNRSNVKSTTLSKSSSLFSIVTLALGVIITVLFIVFSTLQINNYSDGTSSFSYDDLTYKIATGAETPSVIVTGYNGKSGDVEIPDMLEDHKVIAVSDYAFYGNTTVETLKVSGDVIIGKYAFAECENLVSVDLRAGRIGERGFYGCESLKTITAENVSSVGDYAFSSCKGLESVGFYGDDKSLVLGGGVFFDSSEINSFSLLQKWDYVNSEKSCLYGITGIDNLRVKELPKKDNKTITLTELFYRWANLKLGKVEIDTMDAVPAYFCGNYSVNTLQINHLDSTAIQAYAFYGALLSDLITADAVTSVGARAFENAGIVRFDGRKTMEIGEYAFSGCKSLSTFMFFEPENANGGALTEIQEGVFNQCSALNETILPSTVTSIGTKAFWGCENMTTCLLPNSLVTIKRQAFSGNKKLKRIDFPATLTDMEMYAFSDCKALTDITLPDGLRSMGHGVFEGCSNIRRMTLPFIGSTPNDTVGTLVGLFGGYDAQETEKVPSTLTEIELTQGTVLPDYAFYNCGNLRNVYLPTSLKRIGAYAFCGNALERINIPDGVNTIGTYAFSACNSLTSLTVPSSVEEIGQGIVCNDWSLQEITLPFFGISRMEERGLYYVFGADYHYLSYYVPSSLKTVTLTEGTSVPDYAFYDCRNLTTINLPEGVETIGAYAYYGTSFTEIEIPETITSIGNHAFSECDNLTTIGIPASVQSIGEYAFSFCESLTTLTIPSSVEEMGIGIVCNNWNIQEITLPFIGASRAEQSGLYYVFGAWNYDESWQYIPDSLKTVTLTEGTFVPEYAFYECQYLTAINLPEGIETIGAYAYYGTSFAEIEIPQTITSIGEYAFAECDNLTAIEIPTSVQTISRFMFYGCDNLTTISIPETVTTIGEYAFASCNQITAFTIPATVNNVGFGILNNCNNLAELTLPFIGTSREEESGLYYLFGAEYYYWSHYIPSSLKTVMLTEGTNVPDYAFYDCRNLTRINLPEGVETIGAYAYCATTFTEIEIPGTVTRIGEHAFAECANLTAIEIPASVQTIGEYAFAGCNQITAFTIPATVNNVGFGILNNCNNLAELTLPFIGASRTEQSGLYYLFGADYYGWASSYVPDSLNTVTLTDGASVPDYAFYDCRYLTTVNLPDGIETIGAYAFYNTDLRGIAIPSSVTTIGEYAFSGCNNIQSFVVPSMVESVGFGMLNDCGSLTELTLPFMERGLCYVFGTWNYDDSCQYIPSSLKTVTLTGGTSVPNYAFYDCQYLTTVNLAEGIETIGAYAFYNGSLTEIDIPNTVTSIGEYAFASCNQITAFTIPNTVNNVGFGILNNCNNIAELTLPFIGASRTEQSGLYYVFGTWNYDDSYQYIPSSLKTVTLTGGTSVPDYAFYNCQNLTAINLPESLESIGSYAFKNSGLLSITIPSLVTTIENHAFEGCYRLYEVYNDSALTFVKGEYSENGGIANNALVVCPSTEKAEIVTENDYTFLCSDGTWFLIDINLQEGRSFYLPKKFTYKNRKITEYNVADYLLYNRVYWEVSLLSIPADSVVNIGKNAFSNNSITSVEFTGNGKLKRIGDEAFQCTLIIDVALPEGLEEIGIAAFQYCSELRKITFPSTLTNIGENAFWGCYKMYEITNHSSLPLLSGSSDYGYAAYYSYFVYQTEEDERAQEETIDGIVYLHDDSVWLVIGTTSDSLTLEEFTYQGETIRSVTIPAYVFLGNGELREIKLGSVVKEIGEYAFYNCNNLTKADLSEADVQIIPACMMIYCYNLRVLYLPENLKKISSQAFYNCSNLQAVDLPESVEEIEDYVFAYCYALSAVRVWENLTAIGYAAFLECNQLHDVYDYSTLDITAGDTSNGSIGYYAEQIIRDEAYKTVPIIIEDDEENNE